MALVLPVTATGYVINIIYRTKLVLQLNRAVHIWALNRPTRSSLPVKKKNRFTLKKAD